MTWQDHAGASLQVGTAQRVMTSDEDDRMQAPTQLFPGVGHRVEGHAPGTADDQGTDGHGHPPRRPTRRPGLRARLLTGDVLATALGWSVAVAAVGGGHPRVLVAIGWLIAVATTLAVLTSQRLYLARVCSIQSVEIQRLGRVALITGALLLVALIALFGQASLGPVAAGSAASFGALTIHRMRFRSWLRAQRRHGRHARPLVLLGQGTGSDALATLLAEQPEAGFELVGTFGPPADGNLDDVIAAVGRSGASGVIIDAGAWQPQQLNDLIRRLLDAGMHVHMSTGVHGISARRLSVVPVEHEPLFYVEGLQFSRWQRRGKRVLDVVISSICGLVTLPLVGAAALLIKRDGGPAFYRQERVGRGGRLFTIYKLRTMSTDADRRLHEVAGDNARNGPLFKAQVDPRVTRIGRMLRASSIDELPQLWNVLTGTMSLVGPRPALAAEVEEFDADLSRLRRNVLPGITGLWQVEARDNPAFGPYRRLDIFYVENWSIWLDISILIATVGVVSSRVIHVLKRRLRRAHSQGTTAPVPAVLE